MNKFAKNNFWMTFLVQLLLSAYIQPISFLLGNKFATLRARRYFQGIVTCAIS